MRLSTPDQMNKTDRNACTEYGIPVLVLMENAANALVATLTAEGLLHKAKHYLILAGSGNNGGDGYALARHLHCGGYGTQVLAAAPAVHLQGAALENRRMAEAVGVPVLELSEMDFPADIHSRLAEADIIIDALFGTGLARPVEGPYRGLIECVNKSGKTVVAVDIPSGINALTGEVMGCAVKAALTVSFCLYKTGQLLYPGRQYCGKKLLYPISLPYRAEDFEHFTFDQGEAADLLRRYEPQPWANKGDLGKTVVIAGQTGMTGAAALCAEACLKSGCGLVTLAVPASLNSILEVKTTAAMTRPIDDEGKGYFTEAGLGALTELCETADTVVIGPGTGRHAETGRLFEALLPRIGKPLILDADCLYHVSANPALLADLKNEVLITPHPGEMARLCAKSIAEVSADPVGTASGFSQRFGVTTLLKGACTVVAATEAMPMGKIYLNQTGNWGMATGGSGDVLSGVIAALCARGMALAQAASLGAYIHGLAGDLAASRLSGYGVTAEALADCLPQAFLLLAHEEN